MISIVYNMSFSEESNNSVYLNFYESLEKMYSYRKPYFF